MNTLPYFRAISLQHVVVLYAFLLPLSRAGIVILSLVLAITGIIKSFNPVFRAHFLFVFKQPFVRVLLGLIGFVALSLLWSADAIEGLDYMRRYMYFVPLFVIAALLEKKYLSHVISAFLLGMLVSEFLSYGIFFELFKFRGVSPRDPTPFMNHLQYSAFLAFTSLFLLARMFYEPSQKLKWLYGIFFLTTTANIFVNSGRIGYVAFALTLFVVISLHVKNKIKASLITIGLIVGVIFVSYQTSPNFKQRINHTWKEIKLIEQGNLKSSFGRRLSMWYVGGLIVKDNPVLGVGAGSENVAKDYYATEVVPKFKYVTAHNHLHNSFVSAAVNFGLIGLEFMLALVYFAYKVPIQDVLMRSFKYIFVTSFFITCLTGNMFHQQFTMALFALMMGLILAQSRFEVTFAK